MSFRTEVIAVRLQVKEDGTQQLQFFPDETWYPAKECPDCRGWGIFTTDTAHGDRGEMCARCDGIGAVKDG